jgi:hypothetical protein
MALAQKEFDFNEFISYLEAKKKALEALITSAKAAHELGALGPQRFPRLSGESAPVGELAPVADPIELPRGALLNKSLPDAIRLYLSAVKKKQNNKEIVAALKDAGVESTSANFEGVVAGALKRLKDSHVLLRFDDGWGLAELYPESLRARLLQNDKPASKKKAAKRTKAKKSLNIERIFSEPGVPQEGLEHRIKAVLEADRSQSYLPNEMAEKLSIERPGRVATALGRMAGKHTAEKIEGGKYRAYTGGKAHEMQKAV